MQTTTFCSTSLRRLVLALLAVGLAMSASAMTGEVGPHRMTVAAESNDRGNVTASVDDAEDPAIVFLPIPGYTYDVSAPDGGNVSVGE